MSKAAKSSTFRRAIIYIRVSTEEQATGGVSLAAQLGRAEAWANQHGYQVQKELIFTDAGMSGKRADNRPRLQAAIKACRAGDALVVYSLSRLARSTKDALVISEMLCRRKCDLVSLTENLDTTTAAGKAYFGMLAVWAQFERDLVSERTSTALQHKRACGEAYSRPVYGFDRVGDELRSNPQEQAALKQMRTMRRKGLSYACIAEALSKKRVPTKRGGLRWYASTVHSVLRTILPAGA